MTEARYENELRKKVRRSKVYLVEIDHPEGMVWLSSGYRHLSYAGNTWLGVGLISELTFPADDASLDTERGTAVLSGVDEAYRYLTEGSVLYRSFRVWKAFLDADSRVVGTRMLEDAVMDTIMWEEGDDDTGSIRIEWLGKLAFMSQQHVRRRTPEHHKQFLIDNGIDPDLDTGFDRQANIVDENPAWWPPKL